MRGLIQSRPLFSFFLLAYAFTWVITVPMALGARGIIPLHLPEWLEALSAFGPFAAALIVLTLSSDPDGVRNLWRSIKRWDVSPLWLMFVVLSPCVVLLVAFALAGNMSGKGMAWAAPVSTAFFIELLLVGGVIQAVGEEPGWRGLALEKLRGRHGPLVATLLLFPVWLIWHAPVLLSRPEFGMTAWLGFSAGILSAAIWCTFIYDATRSVLMVIIWHAAINYTRGIALAVSMQTFLVFGQVVLAAAVLMVIVWLIRRPEPYNSNLP